MTKSHDRLTENDIRAMLREKVKQFPSQNKAAIGLGLKKEWLSMILTGRRRPCGRVLDIIGVKRNGKGPAKCVDYFLKGA
jgi:hypothetical protein